MSEQNKPLPTYDGLPPEPLKEEQQTITSGIQHSSDKPKARTNPFPVLTFVSGLLKVLGWITALIAIFVMLSDFTGSGMFGVRGAIGLLVGPLGLGLGLSLVALGESIGVLFAIEVNTRRMADDRSRR